MQTTNSKIVSIICQRTLAVNSKPLCSSKVTTVATTVTKRRYPLRVGSSGGQRRFFSNQSGNNGNHKTRRKRPSQLPLTTREKLHYRSKPLTSRTTLATSISQAFQQTVQNAKQGKLIDEELLAERMTDRMSWARGRLYSFWTEVAGSQSAQGAAIAGRPKRYELVMDANWWFWNILMGMTPAVLLAAYCEFVVHPRMAQEKAEQEAQEAAGGGHQQNMKPSLASTNTSGTGGASISAEGFVPPSAPTLQESFTHLMRWMQGLPPSEENETVESASGTPSPVPLQQQHQQQQDHPQLEQLRALKQKIEAMEAQLLAGEGKQSKNGEEVHDPSVSPILQRRMIDSSSSLSNNNNNAPRQPEPKTHEDTNTSQGVLSDTLHWMEQLQETVSTFVPDVIAQSLPLPPWNTSKSMPPPSTPSADEPDTTKVATTSTSISHEASTSDTTTIEETQESPSSQDTTHHDMNHSPQTDAEANQASVPSPSRPWWKVW